MKRLALLALLLAAPTKHGYHLLEGPMPHLAPLPVTPPLVDPHLAPVPNLDAEPPHNITPKGPRLVPALTNRLSGGGPGGDGYAPGSSYAPQLERRRDPGTNIGNILAPGLQLRVPLQ